MRVPPTVWRFPTPHPIPARWYDIALVLALPLAAVATPAAMWSGSIASFVFSAALVTGILVGVFVIRAHVKALRRYRGALARFHRYLDQFADDPVVRTIRTLWAGTRAAPSLVEIARRLEPVAATSAPGGMVVLINTRMPPPGDYRFEPQILTAADMYPWLARGVLWVVGLVMLAILITRMVSGAGRMAVLPIGCFLVFLTPTVAVGLVAYLWRTFAQPSYVRMAPGQIDVLRFSALRWRSRRAAFPIAAGTVVVVGGAGRILRVALRRGSESEFIDFGHFLGATEAPRAAAYAIMSTAPTPPLPDDELLG